MRRHLRPCLFALALLLAGCCAAQAQDPETMQRLGSALSQLTPAVEGVVCCDPEAPRLSDREILERATRGNPRKLEPFAEYTLVLTRLNGHASLLVCTGDGGRALLEDAGCTMPQLDEHHWRDRPGAACRPMLDLSKICP